MSDYPYKNAVCRGSYVLGTACGRCERCVEERAKLATPTHRDAEPMTPQRLAFCESIQAALRGNRQHDAADVVSDLLAELRRHRSPSSPQETGWRTIDSAPKDGTEILVLAGEKPFYYLTRWYAWGWVLYPFVSQVRLPYEPTHWMPLPEPPKP